MKILQNRFVIIALRCGLAAVFIYAGTTKLGSSQNFSDSIATFAILPNGLINLIALALPPFEIIAGLAVITGIQRRPAVFGLAALTLVFILALGAAIVRGIPVDCGCFGSGKPSASTAWIALGRDVVIFIAGLLLYHSEIKRLHARTAEIAISGESIR